MSVESFAELERPMLGARLAALYGRWTVCYLLGVLVLWLVGIESIYENVTPFYAVLKPAFGDFVTPAGLLGFVWLAYLVAVNVVYRKSRSLSRMALSFVPWLVYLALIVLPSAWAAFRLGSAQAVPPATVWAEFRWHLLAFAVFAAFLGGLIVALRELRWFEQEPSPRAVAWMLVALVFFGFAFAGVIAMLRNGPAGIADAYSRYSYEYISDIGFGRTLRGLFAEYVQRHPFLSMHAKVHPPGPIALLWILSYVAGREALGLSVATMAVGSLAVIPLYFWAKDLLGKRVALTACLVYVFVPSVTLFTATSADILFMPFTLLTLFLFWRALHRHSLLYAVAAGLMFGFVSLLSFSLLSLGAFFAFVGLWRLTNRNLRYAVVQTAVVMFVSFLALHMAVRLWSGFDFVDAFHAAKAQFNLDQQQVDITMPRYPSWAFKFINPLAWLYFAGIPVSVLFLWRLAGPESDSKRLFIAFGLTLVAIDLLYLARGEGERSALYFVPFVVLPAAHALDRMGERAAGLAPLVATLSFLAFQCWLTESLFYTYW